MLIRYLVQSAVALVFLGLVIAGCVSTKATMLSLGETYTPIPADSVRIYMSETELDTLEYVRVAIIEATGSAGWTSQSGMYNAMRKKAASLGCNGVLLPQINEPGAGAKVAGAFLGTGTERKGEAVAIRVLGRKKELPKQEEQQEQPKQPEQPEQPEQEEQPEQ